MSKWSLITVLCVALIGVSTAYRLKPFNLRNPMTPAVAATTAAAAAPKTTTTTATGLRFAPSEIEQSDEKKIANVGETKHPKMSASASEPFDAAIGKQSHLSESQNASPETGDVVLGDYASSSDYAAEFQSSSSPPSSVPRTTRGGRGNRELTLKRESPKSETKTLIPARITSLFGMRVHPLKRIHKLHAGIDIAVPVGTPARAWAAGRVKFVGWAGGYGVLVALDHGDGVETRYGHLSEARVLLNQIIAAGEVIARTGNTGASTGAHLHFEARVKGQAINPHELLQLRP